MKDYKELANALCEWSVLVDNGELDGMDDGPLASDLMRAADAIEELMPKTDMWEKISARNYRCSVADFCSHGEWIVCGDGENVPYLCSHCGKTVPAILIEKYPHNYCPNCGARMD